jgi:hypothetical protein
MSESLNTQYPSSPGRGEGAIPGTHEHHLAAREWVAGLASTPFRQPGHDGSIFGQLRCRSNPAAGAENPHARGP